ncbi:MAG: DUF2214 family protein [Rhodocyclaceae bacterium]
MSSLLALLHFIAIGALVFVLAAEWATLRAGRLTTDQAKGLARLDFFYMLAAMAVIITGLARVFLGDKPAVFYAHNGFFHAKIGLFVLIGLLSILPTVRFARWRKQIDAGRRQGIEPAEVAAAMRWVRSQLLLLPLVPVMAVFMARGWPW